MAAFSQNTGSGQPDAEDAEVPQKTQKGTKEKRKDQAFLFWI
jgi:hypothetical protein